MTKIKKFLACAAAVMTLTATATAANVSADYSGVRGDVNNNGSITSSDYTSLLRYYFGYYTPGVTAKSADVSGDGKVSYLDLVVMSNIRLGKDENCIFVKGDYKYYYPGDTILDDGTYYSKLCDNGNLETYKRSKGKADELIFESHTKYYEDFRSYKVALQTDGNVVIYGRPNYDGAAEKAIWSSGTCIYNKEEKKTKQLMLCYDSNGQFQYYGEDGVVWQGKNLPENMSKRSYMSDEDRRKVAEYRINYSLNTPDFHNGFKYSDFEAAAIDFALYYNERSIEEQTEYGTTIERVNVDGKEKYVINMHPERGLKGEKRGLYTVAGTGPYMSGYYIAAWVHTHGHQAWGDWGWQNNYFSVTSNYDSNGNLTAKADVKISQEWGVPAYLGAPNGTMRKYDPAKDPVKTMTDTGNLVTYYDGRQVKVPNNAIPEDAK